MKVNWKKNERTGFERGDGYFTYRGIYHDCHLAQEGIRLKSVQNTIDWLKRRTQIRTQKTTRGFRISLINYGFFQDPNSYEKDGEQDTEKHKSRIHSGNIKDTISKEGINRDKKEKITAIPDKPYLENTSVEKIIGDYKQVLGLPRDDRLWNKKNFARNIHPAEDILAAFDGDEKYARWFATNKAIELREWAKANNKNWSLEAVARQAVNARGEFLQLKEKRNADTDNRKQMGTDDTVISGRKGGIASAGELADSFRRKVGYNKPVD